MVTHAVTRFKLGTASIGGAVVALIFFWPGAAAAADAPPPACQGASQSQSLTAARTTLEHDPSALEAQLKLADALIEQDCYQDAIAVLESAQTLHPRSGELQARLREARSLMSEERYIDRLGDAAQSAKLQRDLLRCTQLADISACDEALQSKPDDPAILLAKGDALLQANHPADALAIYRHAAELSPATGPITAKLAAAESLRQTLLSRCENDSGAAALDACQSALLPGAGDEFSIYKRKAILLQSIDQPEQALDSYIAANFLKQDDKAIALAIVALTRSTGRQDALALAARGTALLTLGRATESVSVLRQARALAPTLPGIESQLSTAEALASAEGRAHAEVSAHAEASRRAASTRIAALPATPPPPLANDAPGARSAHVATPPYSNEAPPGRTN